MSIFSTFTGQNYFSEPLLAEDWLSEEDEVCNNL